jgi:hypothetical protein
LNRVAALVSLLVLVAGCSAGTAAPSQPSPTPSPSPSTSAAAPAGSPLGVALPAELVGTWSVLLGPADVAAIAVHVPGFDTAGVWTVKLAATTFQLLNPDGFTTPPVPAGIDAATHLRIADIKDCPDQLLQTGGVYAYQVSATTLTLSPVGDDACPFRGWLLRAKPWTKA